MASTVAMKVKADVMISSPGFTPMLLSATKSADVPLLTARACLEPTRSAKAFSNSDTRYTPLRAAWEE